LVVFLDLVEFPHDGLGIVLVDAKFGHGTGRVPQEQGTTTPGPRPPRCALASRQNGLGARLVRPGRAPMTVDCLFCKIGRGESPAKIVYEDDQVLAFEDINPQAPTHVLIIPRRHFSTLNDLQEGDATLLGSLITRAAQIAKDRGHAQDGYRTVFNCNGDAGQSVFHIHLHLLAGRYMSWPPW
jgi:histidine triad (HIT) family protein